MMKKLTAALLAALLLLGSVAAFAATYTDPDGDFTFEYDDALFEITDEDVTDDECMVIVGFKDEAWGEGYIRLHLQDLEDGETFPTMDDFAEIAEALDTEVSQGDWAGFTDVFSYVVEEDGAIEQVCVVPVYDAEDGEVEEILTVSIAAELLEDDGVSMARDDQISALVDSIAFIDD